MLLTDKDEIEGGDFKAVVSSFFRDLVEMVKEYSSVHRHKYNTKNSKTEEALMVEKIEKPFKKSKLLVETDAGNILSRRVNYYFGRKLTIF